MLLFRLLTTVTTIINLEWGNFLTFALVDRCSVTSEKDFNADATLQLVHRQKVPPRWGRRRSGWWLQLRQILLTFNHFTLFDGIITSIIIANNFFLTSPVINSIITQPL